MKVIYIYGVQHSTNQDSIVIKPDIDLVVNDGDVFAIMFFMNDRIEKDNIIVELSSSSPLQYVFDTDDNELNGRCPLALDGTVELSDNCFVVLKAKLSQGLETGKEVDVNVNVRWASLSRPNASDIYPPVMEIKVKP